MTKKLSSFENNNFQSNKIHHRLSCFITVENISISWVAKKLGFWSWLDKEKANGCSKQSWDRIEGKNIIKNPWTSQLFTPMLCLAPKIQTTTTKEGEGT